MQPVHHRGPRFAGWLVAALLLLAQWGALAHQIEHQTHVSDAPCVVCIGADQFGNAMPSKVTSAPVASTVSPFAVSSIPSPESDTASAFQSRAPPFLSWP